MSESDVNAVEAGAPAGKGYLRAHLILVYFLSAAVVIWLLTGFYQVQAGEVALVERLGQFVSTPEGKAIQMQAGLHYHLPWPIDRVHVVSTQQTLTLNVKAFNVSPAEYEDFKAAYLKDPNNPFQYSQDAMNFIFNPYLIAADKTVVHMEIAVNFKVRDAEKWLQAISHEYHENYDSGAGTDMRNSVLQRIAQRVMIQQAARLTFDEVLTTKLATLPGSLQQTLSNAMVIDTANPDDATRQEEIDLGIQVTSVNVTKVRPPDAIQQQYDAVAAARSTKKQMEDNAEADKAAIDAQANAQMQTLQTDAEQYANSRVQAAHGEADRFKQVYEQYILRPEVTRYNLYADAMTTMMGNAKRIFFVHPGDKTYIYVDPPTIDTSKVGATRP